MLREIVEGLLSEKFHLREELFVRGGKSRGFEDGCVAVGFDWKRECGLVAVGGGSELDAMPEIEVTDA